MNETKEKNMYNTIDALHEIIVTLRLCEIKISGIIYPLDKDILVSINGRLARLRKYIDDVIKDIKSRESFNKITLEPRPQISNIF